MHNKQSKNVIIGGKALLSGSNDGGEQKIGWECKKRSGRRPTVMGLEPTASALGVPRATIAPHRHQHEVTKNRNTIAVFLNGKAVLRGPGCQVPLVSEDVVAGRPNASIEDAPASNLSAPIGPICCQVSASTK